ncbi:MAG: Hsp20/alpha crystallin family protein [Desulfovibrionaceae bacterium]
MSNISLWKRQELGRLKSDMARLFDSLCKDFGLPSVFNACDDGPDVDLRETDAAIIVTVSIPGARAEDLDVEVHGDMLTIRCAMHRTTAEGEEVGSFASSLRLPCRVASDKAEATLEQETLTITLPKEPARSGNKVCIHCK